MHIWCSYGYKLEMMNLYNDRQKKWWRPDGSLMKKLKKYGGSEGWSLLYESGSILPVEAGVKIKGLELPSSSGWRTREGCSLSKGGCLRVGMSLH